MFKPRLGLYADGLSEAPASEWHSIKIMISRSLRSTGRSMCVAFSALMFFAGCAAESPGIPQETVKPTQPTPKPLPSLPAETTEPDPFTVPSCEVILPLATAREIVRDQRLELWENNPVYLERALEWSFGPVAGDAIGEAIQLSQCAWGYPQSDVSVSMFVTELPHETRKHLVAELRESVFIERSNGEALIFEDLDMERRMSLTVRYAFIGDVWVAAIGSVPLFEPVVARIIELQSDQSA